MRVTGLGFHPKPRKELFEKSSLTSKTFEQPKAPLSAGKILLFYDLERAPSSLTIRATNGRPYQSPFYTPKEM